MSISMSEIPEMNEKIELLLSQVQKLTVRSHAQTLIITSLLRELTESGVVDLDAGDLVFGRMIAAIEATVSSDLIEDPTMRATIEDARLMCGELKTAKIINFPK